MVTVVREDGLRLVIYLNDHPPAHVHVFGDGEAKIDLVGSDRMPRLVWTDNMTHGEVRRAMRLVVKHQALLLTRWEDMHGGAR